MKTLVIVDTVIIALIVIVFIIRIIKQNITIQIERTFHKNKPYGISIIKWKYKVGTTPNQGEEIFHFNWRNPKNIE